MVIVIWLIILFVVIVVAGELTYRYFNTHKENQINNVIPQRFEDSIDVDMDSLNIESTPDELISMQILSMRGSWRLAQNQTMSNETFAILRDNEYNKFL